MNTVEKVSKLSHPGTEWLYGYTKSCNKDFLPGSAALPQKVFTPKPKETKPEKYAWEED
jgi:hypothetical protein